MIYAKHHPNTGNVAWRNPRKCSKSLVYLLLRGNPEEKLESNILSLPVVSLFHYMLARNVSC